MYDNEADKKESPRQFRTKILNELFEQLPNGSYRLRKKTSPSSWSHESFSRSTTPRTVTWGTLVAALVEAINSGEVKQYTDEQLHERKQRRT